MRKENQIVDYKQIVRRLKACVFTVIDPALASEAALAIQLLCEENQTQRKQSEGKWISVEERLPEKDGRYLVAMKDGDKYHISTRRFKRTDPPIWWKGHVYGHWSKRTCGVRFWMPLPEPPKGD